MSSFFDELKRRNVIKAAIAYAVIAWVVLQVLSIVLPNVGAPEWVMKTITILIIVGFPVWALISWVYEVTPEGLKKTAQVSKNQSITASTNKRLNILILAGLVVAITVSFINRSSTESSNAKDLMTLDNSIAVLPFDDMSSGGDTQWFCDGVTEDILTNLARLKELKVISRTSTERYKNTDKSIPEIAAELGVSYVVEGSVRRHEDKVIITAQLIDANDTHVWAQNYDDNFEEVFKIQQDVSQKIVGQLKIAISPEERKELTKLPTDNIQAYNLILKGRSFSERGTKDDISIGIDFFKQAITLDPNYADAYAELAYANLLNMYINDNSQREGYIKESNRNNEIALKLDPNSVRANSTKGLLMTESPDKKIQLDSEQYFKKALELNPNDAVSHLEISIFYDNQLDDNKKSLIHARRAFELNPFSTDVVFNLASSLKENELFDEAHTMLEVNKNLLTEKMRDGFKSVLIDSEAKAILKNNGTWKESIAIYETAIEKNPDNVNLYSVLGTFYDTHMNDDLNAVKYLKRTYEIDSSAGRAARNYQGILCEANQFDEAERFANSDNYKKVTSDYQKLQSVFYFNYHQEKYETTETLLQDSLLSKELHLKVLVFAQLGEKDKVYDLFKNEKTRTNDKAMGFAILQERDSLYHYLEKDDINFAFLNSRRELDLYRKESRYIAFMKKNNLPILEKFNGKPAD